MSQLVKFVWESSRHVEEVQEEHVELRLADLRVQGLRYEAKAGGYVVYDDERDDRDHEAQESMYEDMEPEPYEPSPYNGDDDDGGYADEGFGNDDYEFLVGE